jgi:hypothetical protein
MATKTIVAVKFNDGKNKPEMFAFPTVKQAKAFQRDVARTYGYETIIGRAI